MPTERSATVDSCDRDAFTLLEVMVALAIFGMAIVVLGSAYVNVLNSFESIRTDPIRDEEIEFAFSRILAHQIREDFEAGGTVETLHAGDFEWEAVLERTLVADLFEAEVSLTLPERESGPGGRRREVTETFLLFRPGWEDPVERDELREETRQRLEESRIGRGSNATR